MKGFPDRLTALLKQKQLTLAQVAKEIGTSAPSVHRWTRGGEIEYANLRTLSDFLEVNWVWLRYGDAAINDLQENQPDNGTMTDLRRKYLSEILESEARMNLAQEMAHIVTWEWNVLSGELTVSPNAANIFGMSMEEVRPALIPFETLPLDELIIQYNNHDHPLERDFSLHQSGGDAERWFASRSQLQLDAQQRPSRIVGVCIDVTQRKQTEAALERSEHLLRKVIEIIPVGLFIADQNGRIATANPEATRIWGEAKLVDLDHYSEYKGWWESSGEEVGSEGWTLARAVQNGETSLGEIVNIEAFDGEQRTIIMSAIPLLDAKNRIMGAIEVNQDITDIKRTEKELRNSMGNWRTFFEQPLVGIAYFNTEEGILQANHRFSELLGQNTAELSAEKLENLLDPESGKTLQKCIASAQHRTVTTFRLQAQSRSKKPGASNFQLFCIHDSTDTKNIKTLFFGF